MSAQPIRQRYFGVPEEEAWRLVMDAVEEAMDVPDLSHRHFGRLAELHSWCGWHIGGPDGYVPGDWKPAEPLMPWQQSREPGGIGNLGLSWPAERALVAAGVVTVDQLREFAAAGHLTALDGIGPKRAAAIRAAIERYRSEQAHATERTT